jgi:hypothetical protein
MHQARQPIADFALAWMAGTSPAMTLAFLSRMTMDRQGLLHERHAGP